MTTTLSLVVDSARTQIRNLADRKEAAIAVQADTTDYDVAMAMQERGEIESVKVYPFDRIADAMTDLAAVSFRVFSSPPRKRGSRDQSQAPGTSGFPLSRE
jgi:hypothetical protein